MWVSACANARVMSVFLCSCSQFCPCTCLYCHSYVSCFSLQCYLCVFFFQFISLFFCMFYVEKSNKNYKKNLLPRVPLLSGYQPHWAHMGPCGSPYTLSTAPSNELRRTVPSIDRRRAKSSSVRDQPISASVSRRIQAVLNSNGGLTR